MVYQEHHTMRDRAGLTNRYVMVYATRHAIRDRAGLHKQVHYGIRGTPYDKGPGRTHK